MEFEFSVAELGKKIEQRVQRVVDGCINHEETIDFLYLWEEASGELNPVTKRLFKDIQNRFWRRIKPEDDLSCLGTKPTNPQPYLKLVFSNRNKFPVPSKEELYRQQIEYIANAFLCWDQATACPGGTHAWQRAQEDADAREVVHMMQREFRKVQINAN